MSVQVGDSIAAGQYAVVKVLEGGFSEVLIVEERGTLRRAIKRVKERRWQSITGDNRERLTRLLMDEAFVWQTKLDNCPYTAKAIFGFYDFFGLGPAIIMEAVDGPSLQHLRETEGRLSVTQSARIALQLAEAMRFAHEKDVLHRDLKPSNILLTRSNEVRVVDWGLCSARGAAGDEAYSVNYASPQRVASPSLADPKDDVFAYGAILYRCLTGNVPVRRHWGDEEILAGLRDLDRQEMLLPDELTDIVASSLRHDPDARPGFREIAKRLSDPTFIADLQKREPTRAFCPRCQFVSALRAGTCLVCDERMRVRVPYAARAGMVRIQPGPFVRGLSKEQAKAALLASGRGGHTSELEEELAGEGQKKVFLPAFDIDEYPVTNLQFDAFCKAVNYPEQQNFAARKVAFPDHPVVDVTWRDALCYALWSGKRLPSPQEWERAARGCKDDRPYPWGQNWDQRRCNNAREIEQTETTEVTRYTTGDRSGRSPDKVADMVGNVSEWVSEGKRHGFRGVRGGSWNDECIIEGLVSHQVDAAVDYHSPATGFRCAADIVYEEKFMDEEGVQADAAQ